MGAFLTLERNPYDLSHSEVQLFGIFLEIPNR